MYAVCTTFNKVVQLIVQQSRKFTNEKTTK